MMLYSCHSGIAKKRFSVYPVTMGPEIYLGSKVRITYGE